MVLRVGLYTFKLQNFNLFLYRIKLSVAEVENEKISLARVGLLQPELELGSGWRICAGCEQEMLGWCRVSVAAPVSAL